MRNGFYPWILLRVVQNTPFDIEFRPPCCFYSGRAVFCDRCRPDFSLFPGSYGRKAQVLFVLGEFLGFTSYYFTLGKLISRFTKSVINAIIYIWKRMWEIILYPFRVLYKFIKRIIKKPIDKLQEIFKNITIKILSFFKKSLKGRRKVLYNQLEASEDIAGTAPRIHKKGKRRK